MDRNCTEKYETESRKKLPLKNDYHPMLHPYVVASDLQMLAQLHIPIQSPSSKSPINASPFIYRCV